MQDSFGACSHNDLRRVFHSHAMPKRAVLSWCQTARWAFVQTVTLLPLATTDGVSHTHCVKGWVTSLQIPHCVLNLIWTTQTLTHTDIRTYAQTDVQAEETKLIKQRVLKVTIFSSCETNDWHHLLKHQHKHKGLSCFSDYFFFNSWCQTCSLFFKTSFLSSQGSDIITLIIN